ncbi:hypothetical protein, partial [Prevotella melaninogenica]|uniref:hypothetical protein n=1 Tax=Prevotella melaninogenica TaxID=28132 RepID=UPI00241E2C0C
FFLGLPKYMPIPTKYLLSPISCGLSLQATSKPRVKALIKKFNVQILKFKVFNAPWRCVRFK